MGKSELSNLSSVKRLFHRQTGAKRYIRGVMQSLRPGDIVDIVAPSSPPVGGKWKQGLNVLKSWGLKPRFDENSLRPWLFHAHNNRQRAVLLKQAFANGDSSAVWMLKGGCGLQKLLPSFSKTYPLLSDKAKAKLFIGYSDATALHLYLSAQNRPGLHAPHIEELPDLPPARQKELKELVLGAQQEIFFKNLRVFKNPARSQSHDKSPSPQNEKRSKGQASCMTGANGISVNQNDRFFKGRRQASPSSKNHGAGEVLKGRVAGGNLSLLSALAGTAYRPHSFRSRFLFVEDVNEEAYKIDRMLHHALYTGALKAVKAVLFGGLVPIGEKKTQQILKSFSSVFNRPLIFGLPCGHGPVNRPLPLNTQARLEIQNQKAGLKILTK